MKEKKNQQLAREITDFCKERIKSPSVKSTGNKSILHTALASFLALALVSGGAEPNHGSWWAAE
jgi:hypothetical protein